MRWPSKDKFNPRKDLEDSKQLEFKRELPIALHCNYRNKKTGDVYFAFGLYSNQTNAQAGQSMIAYKLAGDPSSKVFVREASEFIEKFERFVEGVK